MKLYQIDTDDYGWDQYDSFVVAANNKEDVESLSNFDKTQTGFTIEYIGEAKEGIEEGIILGSYNAG